MKGTNLFHPGDISLLQWLVSRCQRNLAADQRAQEYLRSNGIGDEQVWSAFRLGVGDNQIIEELDDAARQQLDALGLLPYKGPNVLVDGGIFLPTFHPSDTQNPVGLIKLTFAQNKHRFATPPVGVACAANIQDCTTIIVVDTPFLGLRLVQSGASGIVIAETPTVLTSIRDWLRERQIILASYKNSGLSALQDALGTDLPITKVRLHTEVLLTNESSLKLLGIQKCNAPPAPSSLIARVVEYSRARIVDGTGSGLLEKLGANNPELVEAYNLGFLPDDFLNALPADAKKVLQRRLIAPAIIIPAFDEAGAAVDLLAVHPAKKTTALKKFMDVPAGLLAPRIATTSNTLLVTNMFDVAIHLWKEGARNVLVLRGATDAKNNAVRLLDAGVRNVKIVEWKGEGLDAAVAALRQAQINVETAPAEQPEIHLLAEPDNDPIEERGQAAQSGGAGVIAASPPSEPEADNFQPLEYPEKPTLKTHDERMMLADFQASDVNYRIETAFDCGSKLEVTVERAGEKHRDRFDLSKAAQRKRFSESAAIKTKTPFEAIERHLIHLLDGVRALQEQLLDPTLRKAAPASALSDSERVEALELLRNPNLLDAVASDMEALGWTGEAVNKRLLYLCSISRLLPMPVSAALRAPASSGKSCALETVSLLTPPEDVVHISRASAAAFHLHPDLRNKLVLIDEADALSKEVVVALRVLQSRGALSQSVVGQDSLTGRAVTHIGETKGPVSVLTSTTREMDAEFIARCYDLTVDTSSEQTKKILEAQRRLRSDPDQQGAEGQRAKTVRRHHALQRLLAHERRAVVTPFADRIEFPSSAVQFRREQQKLLSLIEASALLHSSNRLKQKNASGEEVIIADLRDFEIAVELVSGLILRASDELTVNGRDVLGVIKTAGFGSFALADIKAKRPEWTRHKIYAGLEDLARVEIVTCSRGRGKTRQYALQDGATASEAPVVRLRPEGELSKLSKADNNFTPNRAIG